MLNLGSFLFGLVTTALATVFARPLAVTSVSYGYTAADCARGAWTRTREEAASIRRDARAMYEVRSRRQAIAELRQEIARLRAECVAL